MSNLIVSKSFDRLAEEFKQHDQQTGKSFVAMLNVQEAAKIEYQEATGKVHGFIAIWAEATGCTPKTVKQYNYLIRQTIELRKKSTAVDFSGLSKVLLEEYASAPEEVQEVIQELVDEGVSVTPKDIRQMREPAVIDDEPEEEVWHDELEEVRAKRDEERFQAEMATMPVKPLIVSEKDLANLVALAKSACFHIHNYEFRTGKTVTADKLADMFVVEMELTSKRQEDPEEAYAKSHEECLHGLALMLEAVQMISSKRPTKLTVIK